MSNKEKIVFEKLRVEMYQLLAVSSKYIVYKNCEEVEIYIKPEKCNVLGIGDFYGDAVGAVISRDEKICVMFGEGIIVYQLRDPFETFVYNEHTSQWIEYGREDAHNIKWVDACKFIDESTFEITLEDKSIERLKLTEDGLVLVEKCAPRENLYLKIKEFVDESISARCEKDGLEDFQKTKEKFKAFLIENASKINDVLEYECSPCDICEIQDLFVDIAKETRSREFIETIQRIFEKMPLFVKNRLEPSINSLNEM